MAGDGWDENDPTVVEDLAGDTPVELPRCSECGRVVFFDDFTEPASALGMGLFQNERCVRARDGHWRWCCETRTFVYKVPR